MIFGNGDSFQIFTAVKEIMEIKLSHACGNGDGFQIFIFSENILIERYSALGNDNSFILCNFAFVIIKDISEINGTVGLFGIPF